MKVGIFGGTFNPIHYGHLRAADEVREAIELDKILFVPAKIPPLKSEEIAGPENRYEMADIATRSNKFFELSDIEIRLKGKSYSVKTVEILKKVRQDTDFYFILGIDAFLDIPKWWRPERLVELVNFIVISRPGFRFVDLQLSPYINIRKWILKGIDKTDILSYPAKLTSGREAILLRVTPMGISSSEIRGLIKRGKSINYLLPDDVKSYIIANKLYKS